MYTDLFLKIDSHNMMQAHGLGDTMEAMARVMKRMATHKPRKILTCMLPMVVVHTLVMLTMVSNSSSSNHSR